MKKTICAMITVCFLTTFTTAFASENDYLTADEVTKLYSGNTTNGSNIRGNQFEISYSKDGTYSGIVNDSINISGKWKVDSDGTKCNFSKDTKCIRIKDIGDNRYAG
ncbi:MAG: hypothetical protein GY705_01465, partial [Bacteroidetes bacterium]|nr:hypothetical protein [Bacteroidota bacterium]